MISKYCTHILVAFSKFFEHDGRWTTARRPSFLSASNFHTDTHNNIITATCSEIDIAPIIPPIGNHILP